MNDLHSAINHDKHDLMLPERILPFEEQVIDKFAIPELKSQLIRIPLTPSLTSKHVFLIDDDQDIRTHLGLFLEDLGYRVTLFGSSTEALATLQDKIRNLNCDIDLIISDIRMPKLNGLELLKAFKEMVPTVPIIIITGYADVTSAVEAMKYGAYDYVTKPFQLDRLETLVQRASQHQSLARENAALKHKLSVLPSGSNAILGDSPAIKEVLDIIERVSQTNASILLTGESGTGKEMIARAIHESSPRSKREMVAVNCSAIPENLLESELFGHAKGSFTGAFKHRQGLFEEAEGGTLFLDEIGDMSLPLQAKLLRVLQEKEIRIVGENKTKAVDVRIIAATHRDLQRETERGTFREDLYYRLNVIAIHLPSLQQRRSDIPLLAKHFLTKYSTLHNPRIRGFTTGALKKLMSLRWKGNVRELENAVERAVVFCKTDYIDEMDVASPSIASSAPPLMTELSNDLPTLKKLEKKYIQIVLEKTGGEKDKAAEILGVSQRTLYRKIDELNEYPEKESAPLTELESPHVH